MKTHRLFLLASVFTLSFGFVHPVIAHGSEPRIEISLEHLNPGGIVDVRGVDFEPEELVSLSLTGSSLEISLGVVTADVEGIFIQIVTLPGDIPEGTYFIRAMTDDHDVLSPALVVSGPSILAEEGEALREEEDSLLAPMPTYAPGVVPGGTVQATVQSKPQPATQEAPVSNRNLIFFSIFVLAVGVLALIGLRVARKR